MKRPFPWKCGNCGKKEVRPIVVANYSTEMEHDGRSYSLSVPNLEVLECSDCNNRVLPDESLARILAELRVKAGLLTPAEIRKARMDLGLNQQQLANYLKVAKETVSRWETGAQIQQRSMDLLLRLFFELSSVRQWLGAQEWAEAVSGSAAIQATTSGYTVLRILPSSTPERAEYMPVASSPAVACR